MGRPAAFGARLTADVTPGLLPLLGLTGPDCRLSLNQDMSDRIASGPNAKLHIDDQQLIYWAATVVATVRAALPRSSRRSGHATIRSRTSGRRTVRRR